ncbi:MAG: hypothetical protein EG825_00195 [Rhodocyclaceae bacterium]|nr:hypothetical protein [Rhodocyclaceae bacterium]
MKERPILFSSPMVRAILDGRKTVTRRVVKPKHLSYIDEHQGFREDCNAEVCPYGQPGDRLWVRETWAPQADCEGSAHRWTAGLEGSGAGPRPITHYRADGGDPWVSRWRPSIHMPRWASRILLEIAAVRVERLNDISEEDSIAEGVFKKTGTTSVGDIVETIDRGEMIYTNHGQARMEYKLLWESINGPGSWAANPWVWVIEFRRVK